jgi:hypothetical protein
MQAGSIPDVSLEFHRNIKIEDNHEIFQSHDELHL